MGVEVSASIYGWAALHHRNLDPSLRQMGSKRASTGARANDTHIKDRVLAFNLAVAVSQLV